MHVPDDVVPGLACTTPMPAIGVESIAYIGVESGAGEAPVSGVANGVPQTSNWLGVAVAS